MPQSIHQRVRTLLANSLGVDEPEVVPDANIIDDLGADSLDLVEIVMMVEEEFDLEIPDLDAEKLRTVKDITDYLEKRVKH